VWLATLVDDNEDLIHIDTLEKLTQTIFYEKIGRTINKLRGALGIIKGLPISVSYFYSQKLQRKIDLILDQVPVDLVFCFSSPTAEYVFRSRHFGENKTNIKCMMDFIDVDSYKWSQYSNRYTGWRRLLYHMEWKLLRNYEQRIAKDFDELFIISKPERQIFINNVADTPITVLGNGVDLNYYYPREMNNEEENHIRLVFTGMMNYLPNVDGILWFAKSIFPIIIKEFPNTHLSIVGNRPSEDVRRLAKLNDRIEVTGFVEDVRPFIAYANVCIVPLRIARGIQNKVLEAMAMGRPVVTTQNALQGISATPGKDVIVADDETTFAEAIIDLLQNKAKAKSLGQNARIFAERYCSWKKNLQILEKLIIDDKEKRKKDQKNAP
jgi:sugar transferase (PEP-CTERM/EpsH1 system associated)